MLKPINIQDLAAVTGGINTLANGAIGALKTARVPSQRPNPLIWNGDHVIVSRLPSFVP
jgi:hypothetical protein